jgi:hypothetical protein
MRDAEQREHAERAERDIPDDITRLNLTNSAEDVKR